MNETVTLPLTWRIDPRVPGSHFLDLARMQIGEVYKCGQWFNAWGNAALSHCLLENFPDLDAAKAALVERVRMMEVGHE